ncbi:MAG TPA: TIGR01906 family membrane protein [Candidatus Copromorpha excrementipullorum]|uniref:TIGR01906 family membrane protein n=1 Tax=Candidatus Allocopromorpha excrementipullorum TaxID=2840743 RepID=A0A9D1SUN8_9FIRM|nr:TIGR01906 family membrane protein [Candidatus Copromorpha excrementipullorum]
MKVVHWVIGMIFSFSLIAALLFTSCEIAIYSDFDVYEREYEKYDVLSELDMTMDDAMYVTHEMMDYLRGDRETLSVVTDVDGKRQDFFNQQDRFHMSEVRGLFLGGMAIRAGACVSMVVCIILLLLMKADVRRILPSSYLIALAAVGLSLAVAGVMALVDFNAVFVMFHHLFFDNDLWIFDPAEDYMIRMLPEGLFADMAARIGVIFAAGLVISLILSIAARRSSKRDRRRALREPEDAH